MSLAVQLWLTPSAPHAAELLSQFDESGPVCFPAPPGVWCMTALAFKTQLYSTRGGKKEAEQAGIFFPTAAFSQNSKPCGKEQSIEVNATFFREVLCSGHPVNKTVGVLWMNRAGEAHSVDTQTPLLRAIWLHFTHARRVYCIKAVMKSALGSSKAPSPPLAFCIYNDLMLPGYLKIKKNEWKYAVAKSWFMFMLFMYLEMDCIKTHNGSW